VIPHHVSQSGVVRRAGRELGGRRGGDGVSSPYLIHSMQQPALVSISSDGGPCTGQRKGLGLHIQFQVGGGAQSLVRGALKGEKGLKFLTARFEPENRSREGEREREREGEGPPFWNVNDGVFWFLLGDVVDPKRGKNRGGVICIVQKNKKKSSM
jgi:hypothetical protein